MNKIQSIKQGNMQRKNKYLQEWTMLLLVITGAIIGITSLSSIYAEPEGPLTLSSYNSSRRTSSEASSVTAVAGNVSELVITGTSVTMSWMGFVGNVSGSITLDDFANNTLFNWSLANPEGEVYATYLSTVDWSANIGCWNWSMDTGEYSDSYGLSLGELEGWDAATGVLPGNGNISVDQYDVDGINETFNSTSHPAFFVSTTLISENTCPSVSLFNSTGDGVFTELLIYHNASGDSNDGVIYTSLIESDVIGYNGNTWDFEMIVGEDGHAGDTSTTTYYFYVELE